jgi:hypothetical protein
VQYSCKNIPCFTCIIPSATMQSTACHQSYLASYHNHMYQSHTCSSADDLRLKQPMHRGTAMAWPPTITLGGVGQKCWVPRHMVADEAVPAPQTTFRLQLHTLCHLLQGQPKASHQHKLHSTRSSCIGKPCSQTVHPYLKALAATTLPVQVISSSILQS